MDNTEATRTCGQCHKEVAEANFALHETHCSRFLCVCPDCDETVPREQLDQHKEDQHTVVRCSKCYKKMERRHLMDHESDECVERLQPCQFCELELRWKELDNHSLACGSRTTLCKDCGCYVKLREQVEHDLICLAANNDPSPPETASSPPNKTKTMVQCSGCMVSFPADELDQHELDCYRASRSNYEEAKEDEKEEKYFSWQATTSHPSSTYKAPSLSDRLHRSPWGDAGDPDQISTCPHCHLALPVITLRWHAGKCQRYILLK